MTRVYLRGYALRAADAKPDGPVPFVLATEGRKADGLDLRMNTLDLARYQANPVLGYGHSYWGRDGLPIGRVDNARPDGDRLLGDLVFDPDDDFAVRVERKVRAGFLNAVSVGFDAHDIGRDGVPARWELFETSVVPLPMDPDAVMDAEGRALARALGDVRAGKVLSAKNKGLVQAAVDALTALMDAAATEDGTQDDGRTQPTDDAMRRARLRL
ncbi:hypothetical protein [Kitasatospora sp. MBT63]|uniref:hypothetical protein n=1 Tax=Kitasatospora sp. MBT63 TaxID=1444768 RepID=UPI00053B8AEC|nr:hypothetical protein [Kitasatospora sp. MBT63]